jgi:hypothetical protein
MTDDLRIRTCTDKLKNRCHSRQGLAEVPLSQGRRPRAFGIWASHNMAEILRIPPLRNKLMITLDHLRNAANEHTAIIRTSLP